MKGAHEHEHKRIRKDELISRRVKVGQEWQTRVFPIVGGRLRILHESNDHPSIQSEIVRLDNDFVVVKAAVESQMGKFTGTGTASSQRDARFADSLVELAETRAIARALRFGGMGVEYTGAEEVSHVATAETEREQASQGQKLAQRCANNGVESKVPRHCKQFQAPCWKGGQGRQWSRRC
jgi:hypothetical protein